MSARQVVERFFRELWTEHQFGRVEEIISATCVTHQFRSVAGERRSEARGPTAFAAHIRDWVGAFPDLSATIDAQVVDGDRVVSWVTMRGTNSGKWHGVPPTGRSVVIRSAVMHRIEGGRIVEDWVVTDGFGFFHQLGLVDALPQLLARAAEAGKRKTGSTSQSS